MRGDNVHLWFAKNKNSQLTTTKITSRRHGWLAEAAS